jgi:hypothetical protein
MTVFGVGCLAVWLVAVGGMWGQKSGICKLESESTPMVY